ncbi:ornithine cyclodeaminase family protein [Burkholderia multivorans]|uniref:ornithine cyclodeaminase family protein n=1 Tax=Burkholderia multivorans TaxID=87883 RepID=UPI00209D2433|nr:NAD(P)-binding domain-containing protein [Burkholderia multivorans]MCO8611181.1 ornithine cyclodeaminase family protein [Burkholderia multivorans]MCO8638030.1 ornithine cyclodeaminase family protein [Burkholderia multivorans]MCO8646182.1 ornithine cyclodeaminase family protein [Burkholderia multivorans]
MKIFTNEQVAAQLDIRSASEAIRAAYLDLQRGAAAVQPRTRISLENVKFSAMCAMLESSQIAASKLYTTINGLFRFYIALFSLTNGELLAMLEGDSVTGVRTAATTALAAQYLARPESRSLGLFGSGIQARAHAEAFAQRDGLREVRIHSHDVGSAEALAGDLKRRFDLDARVVDAQDAAAADILVLATRASEPVIRREWLRPGALVASIGATRPDQREIDDASLRLASSVVVDWTKQTPFETGDLLLPPRELIDGVRMVDLSNVIGADDHRTPGATDIVIYKAVGIALQDAAVAYLAYSRLVA